MKKLYIAAVSACCLIAFIFSIYYAVRIYQSGVIESGETYEPVIQKPRIVVITQELESPFANAIETRLHKFAEESNMDVTLLGTYHSNLIELLKYMDIAIASKVDGIIVQAMDGPEFVAKVQKATERGIPVITIGSDAPTSLRKTYVGADHVHEGELIGSRVADQLKGQGKVSLMAAGIMTSTEKLRLQGIRNVFSNFPDINVVFQEESEAGPELDSAKQTANLILNRYPDLNVFIGLNDVAGIGIAQALDERARGENEKIYTFDDTPQLRELAASGRIAATLANDNAAVGEICIRLIRQWLHNDQLPLPDHVFTDVTFLEGRRLP